MLIYSKMTRMSKCLKWMVIDKVYIISQIKPDRICGSYQTLPMSDHGMNGMAKHALVLVINNAQRRCRWSENQWVIASDVCIDWTFQ